MSDQVRWDPGVAGCILRRQLGLGDGTQEKRLGDNGRNDLLHLRVSQVRGFSSNK